MNDYIDVLVRQARSDRVALNAELDEALTALDREMQRLTAALAVEHVGPGVGMEDMNAEHVYKLVVRCHRWDAFTEAWGLKVCDALDNCDLRPMWPVQGTARLRKRQVVKALPEFFAGFSEAVERAGKADTAAGRRLRAISEAFASRSNGHEPRG